MSTHSTLKSRRPAPCTSAQFYTRQNQKERFACDQGRWLQNEYRIDCNALRLSTFLDATEKKNLCNEAMRLVEEAVEQEERMAAEYKRRTQLEQKRRDEEKRQQEYHAEIEEKVRIRGEQLKAKEERLKREREDFLEKKRLQQFIYNCDEIRPELRQRLLLESKASQLAQIQDKQRQKVMDEGIERMWNEVAGRRRRMMESREQVEEQLRTRREIDTIRVLNAQVDSKNQQKATVHFEHAEERRENEQKVREMKEAEQRQIQDKREKQLDLRRDLERQAALRADRMKQFEDMELAMEKKKAELIRNEMELERLNAIKEKRQQREDYDRYLEYMRSLRQDLATAEAERERLIEDVRRKADEEAHRQRLDLQMHRKIMEKEAYAEMWAKISANRERSIAEAKERMQETLEMRKQQYQYALADRKAAEQQRREELEYGRDLKQQEEINNDIKRREVEQDRALAERIRQEDAAYLAKAKALLQSNTSGISTHPHFSALVKHQAQFKETND